jgi:hypothetical protein
MAQPLLTPADKVIEWNGSTFVIDAVDCSSTVK